MLAMLAMDVALEDGLVDPLPITPGPARRAAGARRGALLAPHPRQQAARNP